MRSAGYGQRPIGPKQVQDRNQLGKVVAAFADALQIAFERVSLVQLLHATRSAAFLAEDVSEQLFCVPRKSLGPSGLGVA
jgi:hypothetical protein